MEAPISQFTSKFRLHQTSLHSSVRPMRSRPTRVCQNCQRSKLRCDRKRPCSTCLRRAKDSECTYDNGGPATTTPRGKALETRLNHLESILEGMHDFVPVAETNTSATTETFRMACVEGSEVDRLNETYAGPTHWSAVLRDIHDLRTILGSEKKNLHYTPVLRSFDFNFGLHSEGIQQRDVMSLLASLPTRSKCDFYLEMYFQRGIMIAPFIHTTSFRRQYLRFWEAPEEVDFKWLSMLFSVCCMGSLLSGLSEVPKNEELISEASHLHLRAGVCLWNCDRRKPCQSTLEALGLFSHYICTTSIDASEHLGHVLASAVRMAYELGYHRDPVEIGTYTPFKSEMRRRMWFALRQVDIMTSFQKGLPSIINDDSYDTLPPRNLRDSDFDENTKVLPNSRSDDDSCELLYFVVKNRQLPAFSRVCRDALSFRMLTRDEIFDLDSQLRQGQSQIPKNMQVKTVTADDSQSFFLIFTRIYINFIPLKSLCMLHLKYMSSENPWSVTCCMEAATVLIEQFLGVYKEFAPGGFLEDKRWALSGFTVNDFLLAVVVICLLLHKKWKGVLQTDVLDGVASSVLACLLTRCLDVCEQESSRNAGCKLVTDIVKDTILSASLDDNLVYAANGIDDNGDHLFEKPTATPEDPLPAWLNFLGYDSDFFGYENEESESQQTTW